MLRSAFTACLLFLFTWPLSAQTIRYVKPTAAGTGSGNSWANASADLQAMINASAAGDQVWVMNGVYRPTRDATGNAGPVNARTKTFLMKAGVKVYGSFLGTETSLSDREVIGYGVVCMLSGDIGVSGDNTDNVYHVVTMKNIDAATLLDRFVIRYGNANGAAYPDNYGGGVLWIEPVAATGGSINFCYIENNAASASGGGMAVIGVVNPVISSCSFNQNTAANEGGGVVNLNVPRPVYTSCSFMNNTAKSGGAVSDNSSSALFTLCSLYLNSAINGGGGGVFNSGGSAPVFRGCLFIRNSSTREGSAFSSYSPSAVLSPQLINCTMTENTGGDAVVYQGNQFGSTVSPGQLTIRNSVIWGNISAGTTTTPPVAYIGGPAPVIQYSDVQNCSTTPGCPAGTGNLQADPLFVDLSYLPSARSPLVNAGDPSATLSSTAVYPVDLIGLPRIIGNRIDIGVVENQMTTAIHSVSSNDWDVNDTWSCACVPTRSDNVLVRHAVNVFAGGPSPVEARNLSYSAGGRLRLNGFSSLRLGVRIWYVKPEATGTGDGSSWENASGNLQATLLAAQAGEEVWVKGGVYKPSAAATPTPADRAQSFSITSGVKVYGSFMGYENSITERNRQMYFPLGSVLSGDIGTPSASDNSYHVVWIQNAAQGTLLDGFEIRDGGTTTNTELPEPPGSFTGGGIYNVALPGFTSSPTIQRCHILNNRGAYSGGGMYNRGAGTVTLRSCLFESNYGEYGGALANTIVPVAGGGYTSPVELNIINCNLVNNSCTQDGKAVYGGYVSMTNSIVWGNTGPMPNVIGAYAGGSSIRYSTIQDGSAGAIYFSSTVSNANPRFYSATDYLLRSDSPCINQGDPATTYRQGGALDLRALYRITLGQIDQGCFEFNTLRQLIDN